jgi:D-arabinose 1-dehydrogenase-like Zn-dependent alcohol dehydrogenase
MLMADTCIWTGPLQMLSHTSMKTLTCTSPGNFNCSTTEQPELSKDHAIIKLKRVGICGTDLHAFEGTQPFFSYPCVLGHELSGELVAVAELLRSYAGFRGACGWWNAGIYFCPLPNITAWQ